MAASFKHYFILNLIVFVWGFTGVLGDQISINSERIVFFRMGIAFLSLLLVSRFIKTTPLHPKDILKLLGTGLIVGLHWYTFFYAIKISTVSVAVVCMSSTTLFTAFVEPLLFKRKILANEIVLSFIILIGILLIFGFEPKYALGIYVGLISALLAAFFGVLNGIHIKKYQPVSITKYEMLGGFLFMGICLMWTNQITTEMFQLSLTDWLYLLILGIICTTIAFMVSVWIMKYLSPFTVSLSINMEPIYAIIIALIVSYYQGESSEKMSIGFYFGASIIIGAIFINSYFKKKKAKRKKIIPI